MYAVAPTVGHGECAARRARRRGVLRGAMRRDVRAAPPALAFRGRARAARAGSTMARLLRTLGSKPRNDSSHEARSRHERPRVERGRLQRARLVDDRHDERQYPTNTGTNELDRDASAVTPLDQGGGKDRDITAGIRRNVVADSALGYDAKNVKVVTEGGKGHPARARRERCRAELDRGESQGRRRDQRRRQPAEDQAVEHQSVAGLS